jgi:uncharacterized protein (TIGR02452 family)
MNQKQRIEIANTTMKILDDGYYINRNLQRVDIKEVLTKAGDGGILYKPEDFTALYSLRDHVSREAGKFETIVEVTGETTLQAIERLKDEPDAVVCLNFASAKNPGGGFLNGSKAQEESLARSSGLYPCLALRSMMYTVNRNYDSCLYTDHMIYSPAVPFFKNDDGDLLDNYYTCSVLTVPAVNAGVVMQQEPQNAELIEPTMLARTEKLLSIALVKGYKTLVLGAWGCGVFRNKPEMVAECFRYHLCDNPTFKGAFKKVVFAVLDFSEEQSMILPFKERFRANTLSL